MKECAFADCTDPIAGPQRKWCDAHRNACDVPGCDRTTKSAAMCTMHKQRVWMYGSTDERVIVRQGRRPLLPANFRLTNEQWDHVAEEAKAVGSTRGGYIGLLVDADMRKRATK